MRVMAWPARSNAARNPYQKLLYDAVEAEEVKTGEGKAGEAGGPVRVEEFSLSRLLLGPAPAVLHIHWPDAFLAAGAGWRFWPRYAVLRLIGLVTRLRGTRLVWTAHNLQREGQRHGARMDRLFWPWFLARLDGVIYMTRASQARAHEIFPVLRDRPSACIPHGHYLPVIAALEPAPATTGDEGGDEGGEGPPEALFFGAISRYKNAFKVLDCFRQLPAGSARLVIRGKMSLREPDAALTRGLADLPGALQPHVTYEDRFLSEPELVAAIRAADLVVFPYSDVLNSGSAIFALSAGRPLLASDNALFRELQGQVGADWVTLIPEGALTPGLLAETLERARALRRHGRPPDLSSLDWSRIGALTRTFYRSLLPQPSNRSRRS